MNAFISCLAQIDFYYKIRGIRVKDIISIVHPKIEMVGVCVRRLHWKMKDNFFLIIRIFATYYYN